MDFTTLGGQLLGTIPLGDIVLYFTTFNLFMFAAVLVFTASLPWVKQKVR
jgi:energy-converting hydrogenase A subunit H